MKHIIPDLKFLMVGRLKCTCGNEIPFRKEQGLHFIKCSYCAKNNFIPKKIANLWIFDNLAKGGMGRVFKAVDERSREFCAVKLLPKEKKEDSESIENFISEIRMAKKLAGHRSTLGILDSGHSGEEYYLAMDLVEGKRLDEYVGSQYHLTERESLDIILQILRGEMHIARNGYLFRDIKPENILIQNDGTVKLVDYGLCRELDVLRILPPDNDVIEGSPFYLPPERVAGASEGEYSEIYSLGMLLFYMLTGSTYYSQAEINILMRKHIGAVRVVSTEAYLKHCHREMHVMLDKMIQRNPNDRYHDFQTLKTDLKSLRNSIGITDSSVIIRTHRAGKSLHLGFLARHARLAKAAGISIVLGGLILLASYFAINAVHEKKVREQILDEIAGRFGIRRDMPYESATMPEIKSLISEMEEHLFTSKVATLPPFNPEATLDRGCKELNINRFVKKIPQKTVKEIEDMLNSNKNADEEKLFREAGYVAYDGEWFSENEVLKRYIEDEKKNFEAERGARLGQVRMESRKEAEADIYPRYGYVLHEGRWRHAKEILDEEYRHRIQDDPNGGRPEITLNSAS